MEKELRAYLECGILACGFLRARCEDCGERRLVDPQEGIQGGPLCYSSRGFSLHAATRIVANDVSRLERLCRYVIRPLLAAGQLCSGQTGYRTLRHA